MTRVGKLVIFGIRWAPILQKHRKMGTAADVAELADAQASGACAPRGVEVRVLSSAINQVIIRAFSDGTNALS